ncbi:MAG TPA: hypothetical protein DCR44_03855 [Acholeplasmatales bacterium]|nr:MAG: hypothetical protein A2Y16_01500 [Tenericutes bacterium GWF2_57_13]HAQ56518.1 hypothetical protein [Acholeplasmatales bacterium]
MKKHLILLCMFALISAVVGCDAVTTTGTVATTVPTTISTTSATSTSVSTTIPSTLPTSTGTMAVQTYSLVHVRSDFDQFVDTMVRNPKVFTDWEELADVITAQRALLHAGMTALEFYRVLAVAVAAYRCGHSVVRVPDTAYADIFDSAFTYPVDARLFAGKLMVVSVTGDSAMEVGDEIISIDGVAVAAITQSMMPFLPADGVGTSLRTSVLAESYFQYYLLFLADDDTLAIEYIDAQTASIDEEAMVRDTVNTSFWEPFPAVVTTFFEGYAVLKVQAFQPITNESIESINAAVDAFFTRVKTEGIGHVILDLRGNGGGDPRPASHLFSHLAAVAQPYFRADAPGYYPGLKSDVPLSTPHYDGEVYTLIDGRCFSTCGHFAALLQYQEIGTFIGTETGGSFVCSDGSVEYTLSRTHIEFRTSTMVWGVAVEGFTLGRGIEPDIPLEITFEDYVAGIDTVMAAAVALIEADLHP